MRNKICNNQCWSLRYKLFANNISFSLKGNCNAGPASDRINFGLWAKELREAFKPRGLLLSAAVSAGKPTIDLAYDVPTLGQYLDFINVMSYDLHGHWDRKTGHHSALYQHSGDSSNYLNTVNTFQDINLIVKTEDFNKIMRKTTLEFPKPLFRWPALPGWRAFVETISFDDISK